MNNIVTNWCNKVYINSDVLNHAYETGDWSTKVNFTFVNIKTGKERTKYGSHTLCDAIVVAEMKSEDGRYKNYEFVIG